MLDSFKNKLHNTDILWWKEGGNINWVFCSHPHFIFRKRTAQCINHIWFMIKRSKCILWFMITRSIKRFALCSHPLKQTARFRHLSYDQTKKHVSALLASSFIASKNKLHIACILWSNEETFECFVRVLISFLKNKLHNACILWSN